jgi:hypothetical protein
VRRSRGSARRQRASRQGHHDAAANAPSTHDAGPFLLQPGEKRYMTVCRHVSPPTQSKNHPAQRSRRVSRADHPVAITSPAQPSASSQALLPSRDQPPIRERSKRAEHRREHVTSRRS